MQSVFKKGKQTYLMAENWEEQAHKEEYQTEEQNTLFSVFSLKNLEEVYQNLETDNDNFRFRPKLLLIALPLLLLIIGLPTF